MAHIQKRGPRRYLAQYKGPDGKRRSKTFERKIDAQRFLDTVSVDMLRGSWVDPNDGRVTLGDYARQWVRERPVRASTRQRYEGYVAQLGDLDAVPLAKLRPSMLRTWQAELATRYAPATVRIIRGVVSSVLRAAVVDRLIAASPLDGVPLPPRPDRPLVTPLPAAHVRELRNLITPRLAASVTLGIGSGVRRGEAMGLTVDRVDFLRRVVTIDRQLVDVDSVGAPVFGPPKTRASVRRIPVSQRLLDALAAHLAEHGEGPERLIFTAARGGAVSRAKYAQAWRDAEVRRWALATGRTLLRGNRIPAAVADAWRKEHPDGPPTRYHDLRHFYASALIRDGQSVRVVQARLGHASAVETLDTYSHLWPDDEDRTRGAVDVALDEVDALDSAAELGNSAQTSN